MRTSDRRVLVTGATGFLGRRVVPRLVSAGWRVTALGCSSAASPFDRGVEYGSVDLADATAAESLLPWRWGAVVNLAGPVPRRAGEFALDRDVLLQHVRIALAVRRLVPRDWSGRLVHASSMTVYGTPDELPIVEAHARRPLHMYGLAKLLAEEVFLSSALADRWILRFPGLFSADRREGGLFHFMRAARHREPVVVTASSPTCWDMLDVEDAAEAVLRVLDATERDPGALNISYGAPVELLSIAQMIARMGGEAVAVENRGGADHPVFQMDVARANRLLGGWPPSTLEERLRGLWRAWSEA